MPALNYFLAGVISYFINAFIGTFITSFIDAIIPIKGLSIITEPVILGLFVLIIGKALDGVFRSY